MEHRIIVTEDLTETFREIQGIRSQFIADNYQALKPAIDLLDNLSEDKTFHNLQHTYGVVDAVILLWSKEHRVPLSSVVASGGEELRELLIAAIYHDTGQQEGAKAHEARSSAFAAAKLEGHLSVDSISRVMRRIMATCMEKLPDGRVCQVPARDLSDAILQDADLFNLGATDWSTQWKISCRLYKELFAGTDQGQYDNSAAFIDDSIKFFSDHRYRTGSARAMLNDGKMANIRALQLVSLKNMLLFATI